MTIREQLESYIDRRISVDKKEQFLSANRLDLIFAESSSALLRLSQIRMRLMERVLFRSTDLLRAAGVEPIHFKGCILSNLLYDLPERRLFSDIDFYVNPEVYTSAVKALRDNGFSVQEEFDGHHITLNDQGISVELHTAYFHPNDKIAFEVFDEDLCQITIQDKKLTTFCPTYQFIFLFLHYFTHARKGRAYADRQWLLQRYQSKPIIELSHIYDIVLLIERYGREINWQVCAAKLSPYRMYEEFQCVLLEFSDVFSDFLPNEFLTALRFETSIEDRFPIFFRLISKHNHLYGSILSEIAAHDGSVYSCPNHALNGYRFHIDECDDNKPRSYLISGNSPKSSADVSFDFDFWIEKSRLWFEIAVTDDVVDYLTEGVFPEDYDAIGYCDAVTLCLASAGESYGFHRIYAFPTQNVAGKQYFSVYDIVNSPVSLNNIIESNLIINANGYTARIGIPLDYLGIDNVLQSFYFNVIVSDSDNGNGCNTALAFVSSPNAWYDCRTYAIGKANRKE